ncbi:hypothetical protein E1B28_004024 [Marasmius oreades]|uniref:DUF6699 domain-containing protein n=1 Tax=Marasmius oreades TaxID=181124 RepID=A0A9P7UXS6_9AGAR|nr:uncharacterized protein E1B28_004024 [Marasmius oreades]KAG7096607.1 hypothetical protein E1B28_004024 [Marasmius oreades]
MATDSVGSKFKPGVQYGPVLSQTDLYLLKAELELNPILTSSAPNFNLIFNISSGHTTGINPAGPQDRDLGFTTKDEFATVPRVTRLILITRLSPWCTIVDNENGVTLKDICEAIWKDYSENYITDAEFSAINPRVQEAVKRTAMSRQAANSQANAWYGAYTPAQPPSRFKRYDWLRDKIFFDRLHKQDDYALQRLGFKAPNIFVMDFVS